MLASRCRLLLLGLLFVVSNAASGDVVVVVCPSNLLPAFDRWTEFREAEGHAVRFVATDGLRTRVRDRVADVLSSTAGESRSVWLIGDGRHVGPPAGGYEATVIARYGPERRIASDLPWAAGLGDVAVARLPLNRVGAIREYLDRVIAREQRRATWADTRLQIVAGVGGFSPLIDTAVEAAATGVVTRLAPTTAELSLMRVEQLDSDSLASDDAAECGGYWVWLGHGLRDQLPGLDARSLIRSVHGADVAVLLACYAGDFAAPGRCVAEQLLGDPRGPVAVVAATRVSMPYGNTRLGAELLRGLASSGTNSRLGSVFDAARESVVDEAQDPLLGGLDSMARLFGSEPSDLAIERREHQQMYHLLGDPLLSANKPEALPVEILASDERAGAFTVRGTARETGRLVIEWGDERRVGSSHPRRESQAWESSAGEPFSVTIDTRTNKPTPRRLAVRVGLESPSGLAVAATSVAWRRVSSQVVATGREASFSAAARASTKKPVRSASLSSPSSGAGR